MPHPNYDNQRGVAKRRNGNKENNVPSNKKPRVTGLICSSCGQEKDFTDYSKNQKSKGAQRKCKQCVASLNNMQCTSCQGSFPRSGFTKCEVKKDSPICRTCFHAREAEKRRIQQEELERQLAAPRKCYTCDEAKSKHEYPEEEWRSYYNTTRTCLKCLAAPRLCSLCNEKKPRDEFSEASWKCQQCLKCLTGPRQCVLCKEKKPKDEYSENQWGYLCDTVRKCLKCYPRKVEEADELREQQRKQQRERSIRQQLRHHKCMQWAEQGVLFYDYSDPETGLLPRDEIAGTYAIFFTKAHDPETEIDGEIERTARGTITLKESERGLKGKVNFEPAFDLGGSSIFNDDISFEEVSEEANEIKLQVTPEASWLREEAEDRGQPVLATLSVVQQRHGLAWTQREKKRARAGYEQESIVGLIEKERVKYSSDSWLCRHLNLKPEVAFHVNSFLWRPLPVLFLQPGDIILTTDWDSETQSLVVARKVMDADSVSEVYVSAKPPGKMKLDFDWYDSCDDESYGSVTYEPAAFEEEPEDNSMDLSNEVLNDEEGKEEVIEDEEELNKMALERAKKRLEKRKMVVLSAKKRLEKRKKMVVLSAKKRLERRKLKSTRTKMTS